MTASGRSIGRATSDVRRCPVCGKTFAYVTDGRWACAYCGSDGVKDDERLVVRSRARAPEDASYVRAR